jgi:hypothetical protein
VSSFMNELNTWILSCRGVAIGIVVKNPITRVTSNRFLIRFALAVSVVFGIATFALPSPMITFFLHETYAIIFVLVTILMAIQVVFQIKAERAALSKPPFSFSSSRDRDRISRRLKHFIFHHRTGHPASDTQKDVQNIHPMPDPHSAAHPRDLLLRLDQPVHV